MSLPKENQHYTYADYITWDDDERLELIAGVPCAMSPAPSRLHQKISRELMGQLYNFLKGKSCQVFVAPFDVRLNANEEDDTIVQPDLLVVCDQSKLDDRGCKGAPDLVIEILSPSTAKHDRLVKLKLYMQYGIREYWIVDPDTQTVQVCIPKNGVYTMTMYGETDKAPVEVLPSCEIDLTEVFAE